MLGSALHRKSPKLCIPLHSLWGVFLLDASIQVAIKTAVLWHRINSASLAASCAVSIVMSRHWLAVMVSQRRICDAHGCYCSAKNQLGEICHGTSSVSGCYRRVEDWFTLPQIPSRFLGCASHRPTNTAGMEELLVLWWLRPTLPIIQLVSAIALAVSPR
jgi:hypothetical protein